MDQFDQQNRPDFINNPLDHLANSDEEAQIQSDSEENSDQDSEEKSSENFSNSDDKESVGTAEIKQLDSEESEEVKQPSSEKDDVKQPQFNSIHSSDKDELKGSSDEIKQPEFNSFQAILGQYRKRGDEDQVRKDNDLILDQFRKKDDNLEENRDQVRKRENHMENAMLEHSKQKASINTVQSALTLAERFKQIQASNQVAKAVVSKPLNTHELFSRDQDKKENPKKEIQSKRAFHPVESSKKQIPSKRVLCPIEDPPKKRQKITEESQEPLILMKKEQFMDKIIKQIEKQKECKNQPQNNQKAINDAVGEDGFVPQRLQCFICWCTVVDPRYCKSCETALFCFKCSEKLRKKCCACKQDTKFKPPNRINMQFLEEIKLKCVKEFCSQKNKLITYRELCSSHPQYCQVYKLTCPLKCGEVLTSKLHAEHHFDLCSMNRRECKVCNFSDTGNKFEQHDCLQQVTQQREEMKQQVEFALHQQEKLKKENEKLRQQIESQQVQYEVEKATLGYQRIKAQV